ncbi:antibiotic biosynthesis monooxygenase [Amycolatopsis sp. NBC_00345]|uniref:putative quinol monooxygenase n=1 Tax=Amycolatopsis sp. NBC_00345 TaxID=2975955 RepID=UPI002E274FD6
MTIKSFVTVTVRPGCLDSLVEALAEAVPATRAETGNLRYDVHVSVDHEHTLVIDEEWADQAAIDTHLRTAHMRLLLDRVEGQLDGPPRPHHIRRLDV